MYVIEFVVGIIGRIVSSLSSTYIVRLIDKIRHKNDRLECEQSFLC